MTSGAGCAEGSGRFLPRSNGMASLLQVGNACGFRMIAGPSGPFVFFVWKPRNRRWRALMGHLPERLWC